MYWLKAYTAIFELPKEEKKHFTLLILSFFLTVGAYWSLRSLKDALFDQLVSLHYLPYAKIFSLIVLSSILLLYAKAIDSWGLPTLVRRCFSIYGVLFLAMTLLYQTVPRLGEELLQTLGLPGAPLGWLWYVAIESCGSLLISLFWSFAATTTSSSSAAKGYPWVVTLAQMGSVLGSSSAIAAPIIGFSSILVVSALALLLVPSFLLQTPLLVGKEKAPNNRTSLVEGLRLIVTKPYLIGVLLVSTLYEIPGTILDLQMKLQAKEVCHTSEELAAFIGRFGQFTNFLPMVFALLGTSVLMQNFGVRFCLLLYPTLVLGALFSVYLIPGLNTCFWAAVAVKGLSYGLHNPVKEMLFLPTTRDEKFKAKSWIDSFGGRSSKAIGSMINAPFAHHFAQLVQVGLLASASVTGLWLIVALWLGKRYVRLIASQEAKRES